MTNGKRIVDVLRHCAAVHDCTGCSYGCDTNGLPRNRDLLNDAADAIEELLAVVPRWISVEERLPEENKNYLTYGVFLPLGVKAMDMNRFDGTKWLTSADVEITHWMPLPAPPKEVQDG